MSTNIRPSHPASDARCKGACLLLWMVVGPLSWARPLATQVPPTAGSRQILVKLKEPLARSMESSLPEKGKEIPLRYIQSSEARNFLEKHAAKKLSPLHPDLTHLRRKTGWSDARIAENMRQSFPKRTHRLSRSHQTPEISRTYILEVDDASSETIDAIIAKLRTDPNVEYAEPNHVAKISSLPNDPYLSTSGSWGQAYKDLWGHWAINAPSAWGTSTGSGIVVAVIDTGVDYTHPYIAANMWVNTKEIAGNGIDDEGNGYIDDVKGWDFVGDDVANPVQSNNPVDHHGHGTHVAGTIAAVGNNGMGVIGVAYNAKIIALRGLDKSGSGVDTTLAPAIIYTAKNGADVINASWGGLGTDQTIEETGRAHV